MLEAGSRDAQCLFSPHQIYAKWDNSRSISIAVSSWLRRADSHRAVITSARLQPDSSSSPPTHCGD
jgi:hypothetical protein